MQRRGFTLIEMLVVITVIFVLASMAFPAFTMIKKRMNHVRCGNNLRQIAGGIESYAGEHDDRAPVSLTSLVNGSAGMPMPAKILQCPLDASKGLAGLNRVVTTWDPLNELYESGCSYTYELSGARLTPTSITWFYPSFMRGAALGTPTWFDGKKFQLKNGNISSANRPLVDNDEQKFLALRAPFPASLFPIVRCYWHQRWTASNARTDDKVVNISWDYSVFSSIPYWEHQVNSAIDLPNP